MAHSSVIACKYQLLGFLHHPHDIDLTLKTIYWLMTCSKTLHQEFHLDTLFWHYLWKLLVGSPDKRAVFGQGRIEEGLPEHPRLKVLGWKRALYHFYRNPARVEVAWVQPSRLPLWKNYISSYLASFLSRKVSSHQKSLVCSLIYTLTQTRCPSHTSKSPVLSTVHYQFCLRLLEQITFQFLECYICHRERLSPDRKKILIYQLQLLLSKGAPRNSANGISQMEIAINFKAVSHLQL